MDLRTVTKLVTIISVMLFCVAVGYYAFTHLDVTKRARNVNLYSLVPDDCTVVLETDDISAYLHELPKMNYSAELERLQFPGLFNFIIEELDEYASENAHGLSNQMNRLLVSFHAPYGIHDQVVYLQTGVADKTLLGDLLQEYMSGHFLSKEEEYRGKTIVVYPLNHEEYLSVYVEEEFVVLSFQKRLVEKVIDAEMDGKSLDDDAVFTQMLDKKKKHFFTLYAEQSALQMPGDEMVYWNEYDFHFNSDVLYLTGETFFHDEESAESLLNDKLDEIPVVYDDGLFISADKDSTNYYMEKTYKEYESYELSLFDECIVNLSNEARFSLVADMKCAHEYRRLLQPYLPSFLLDNSALLSSFILSAQYTSANGRLSHIWAFTYKN